MAEYHVEGGAFDRMAFMQGMNYAALLCSVKLEQYPAIIHHKSKKTEEN